MLQKPSGTHFGQSAGMHRQFEVLAVATTVAMVALLLTGLASALDRPAAWIVAFAALLSSYLGADLFSGFVHWAFDRFFDERTPWLGTHFVRPFREHHDDPLEITRHDFIELNGNTCAAAAPVLVATLALFDPAPGDYGSVFGISFVVSLAIWTVLTNQFHKWAHQPNPSSPVRWLQESHIVLSGRHHAGHHSAPFDTRYCITSGIMNGWVDRFRLFHRLESLLGSRGMRSRGPK